MITLDWTFFVTGVVFLFSLWTLNRFLFQPVFKVLEQREVLTRETEEEAAEKLEYRNALYKQYSKKIKQEKQEGYQLAESARKDAVSERRRKITEARARGEEILAKARAEVEQDVISVRDRLRGDAEKLAEDIASRLLEKV